MLVEMVFAEHFVMNKILVQMVPVIRGRVRVFVGSVLWDANLDFGIISNLRFTQVV